MVSIATLLIKPSKVSRISAHPHQIPAYYEESLSLEFYFGNNNYMMLGISHNSGLYNYSEYKQITPSV